MDFTIHTSRIVQRLGRPVQYAPQAGQPRTVTAVMDGGYVPAGLQPGVDSVQPTAVCIASEVTGVRDRDTLIDGTLTYRVGSVQPDGDGLVRLVLHRQE